jgi:Helix-turn-helix domain
MTKLLTENEIEQTYGIKKRTLQTWRQRGDGPFKFLKLNKRVYYRTSDLEAFLENELRCSTSDSGPTGERTASVGGV